MDKYQSTEELHIQTKDLLADKWLSWLGTKHDGPQAQMCLVFSVAFRVLIYFTLGLIPLLANLAATMFSFWSTQFVNTFCHMQSQGYRSHNTRDLSRNVWWVGILALGEGWHNNHHAIPKSARHGFTWFEVDVTWYTIWLLEKIGLAKTVVRPPKLPKLSLQGIRTRVTEAVSDNLARVGNEIVVEPQAKLELETAAVSRHSQ